MAVSHMDLIVEFKRFCIFQLAHALVCFLEANVIWVKVKNTGALSACCRDRGALRMTASCSRGSRLSWWNRLPWIDGPGCSAGCVGSDAASQLCYCGTRAALPPCKRADVVMFTWNRRSEQKWTEGLRVLTPVVPEKRPLNITEMENVAEIYSSSAARESILYRIMYWRVIHQDVCITEGLPNGVPWRTKADMSIADHRAAVVKPEEGRDKC